VGHFEDVKKMITKRDIGLKIRTLRKKAGIETQEELGKKLRPRRAKGTINKIETGRGNYTIDILFNIAQLLKCDVKEFFISKEKPLGDTLIEKFLEEFKQKTIKEYESSESK